MDAKPRVYVETSVISFLTARKSSHAVTAAKQDLTRQWWDEERDRFELYVSGLVLIEAGAGDPGAAAERLEALQSIPVLPLDEAMRPLAKRLLRESGMPARADADAAHMAAAAVPGLDYLLTWNCKHIANATLRPAIVKICMEMGYRAPIMCTPEELFHV